MAELGTADDKAGDFHNSPDQKRAEISAKNYVTVPRLLYLDVRSPIEITSDQASAGTASPYL
jgi:hypothetical protein